MKIFGRITLRTFRRGTEEGEKVSKALMFAAGTEKPEELIITELEGYGGAPLEMMEIGILRQQAIKRFWNSMPERVIGEILETLDKRLDDGQVLHFRLDKEKAYMGEISLASRGAVISVDAKVLSYPASRKAAVKNAGQFLRGIIENRSEKDPS